MGVLDQIKKRDLIREVSRETSSAAVEPDGAAGTCPKCSGGNFWRDAYGTWHCRACQPPASEASVRENRGAVTGQKIRDPESREQKYPSRSRKSAWVNPSHPQRSTASACRCGSVTVSEVPIHDGRSTRADCAQCGRFRFFSLWYGRQNADDSEKGTAGKDSS